MARALFVAPGTTAGTRLFREPDKDVGRALNAYNDRLYHLLGRPYVLDRSQPDALDPPMMQLSPEARLEWIRFHDECEKAIANDGGLATVRAFGAKLAEHAGRLSAVLTIFHDPDAMEIPLVAMQSGVALATYYADEALRLNGSATVALELRVAQRLLTWWQAQPNPTLHLAAIYQLGPTELRDAKAARAAAKTLEESGWIKRMPPNTVVEGKARREAWSLVP